MRLRTKSSRREPTPIYAHAVARANATRVLRPWLDERVQHYLVVVRLIAADDETARLYSKATLKLLRTRGYEQAQTEYHESDRRQRYTVETAVTEQAIVVFADDGGEIAPRLRLAADVVLELSPPEPRHNLAAARECGWRGMTVAEAEFLTSQSLVDLEDVMRAGRPLNAGIRRLHLLAEERKNEKKKTPQAAPSGQRRLEQLHGYGPVMDWGLQLAQDLADYRAGEITWADVDSGAVISGPPGCGKTTLASALAASCGVPLIATSAAQWQAAGHLGDYLREMRNAFEKARKQAPCILFVDEADSLGSRGSDRNGYNDSYATQAINGVLEQLDGVVGRQGVVVIGATNNPGLLDPALMRPGRLEVHLEIPLPDASARLEILAQHLGAALPEDVVDAVSDATEGMTGADLAQIAKTARRSARKRRSELSTDDLLSALPARRDLSPEDWFANAVHEAGHAIVGLVLDVGVLRGIRIASTVIVDGGKQMAGSAEFSFPRRTQTAATMRDQICMLVAGLAAEESVLGHRQAGSGAHPDSDLARATDVAMSLEREQGLGKRLSVDLGNALRMTDRHLFDDVEQILREEFDRAKEVLAEHCEALDRVVERLVRDGEIAGEDVMTILAESRGNNLHIVRSES